MAVKLRKKTGTNTFADPITLLEPSDIAPIDLTNQTVSLLTLVHSLGTSGVQYAKYICKTDGGSANISNRPTTNSAGFVCEVLCNRWVGTNDYRYILRYYQQNDTNAFLSQISQGMTSISWVRTNTNTTYSAGTGLTLSNNQFSVSSANASTILNLLATGSSTPVDNDYYISQYVGGGTTTTSYHRRPMSALWSYVKGKADSVYQPKGTYAGTAVATTSSNGLMSSTDKTRLDNIYTVLNGSDASKIDTIAEVYAFLDDYAQTTDLAALLANKLDKAGGTMTGLLTTTKGATHTGIKLGNTYLTAIDGNVIFQNNTAIRFGTDDWNYNKWAGLKYDGTNKVVYLGIADGTAFTCITNQPLSGGKLYLSGISEAYLGNGTTKIATENYVNNAIANAITTALNTAV